MAIPPLGTFDYQGVIGAVAADGSFECDLVQRPPTPNPWLERDDSDLSRKRLVGWAPRLIVRDAGLTPNANAERPLVARHAFALHATDALAGTRRAAFHVESTILQTLRAGDVLHLVRTEGCDLGISVLRDDRLIVAAGAIAALPLGTDLKVSVPWDLMRQAEDVFRRHDPEFLPDSVLDGSIIPGPAEVTHGDTRIRVLWRKRDVGPYEVHVLHPPDLWPDGTGLMGSICRRGACSRLGATLTAKLLLLPDALTFT